MTLINSIYSSSGCFRYVTNNAGKNRSIHGVHEDHCKENDGFSG